MEKDLLITSSEEKDRSSPPRTSSSKRRKMEEKEERSSETHSKSSSGVSTESGDEGKELVEYAKPIGEILRTSANEQGKRYHYAAFEYNGYHFELEDHVYIAPEEARQNPSAAIIKDITKARDGSIMVTVQWFYRPKEAEKRGGGNWEARDSWELFYSFHLEDVPAESVMHQIVVHFVPLNKQLPLRSQHPGFIIQKIYDRVEKKLCKLTDKDYEDNKLNEIDLLVKQTVERIGELPDIDIEDVSLDLNDHLKQKKIINRKNMTPVDTSRDDGPKTKSDQMLQPEAPGRCANVAADYHSILVNFKALTGDFYRDKYLEKLLQGVQFVCSTDNTRTDNKTIGGHTYFENETTYRSVKTSSNDDSKFYWPDDAVAAVTALEKVSHDALGSDFQKYNQKMRQLVFNLKRTPLLARRLLNKELEPTVILNMSPNELKDGLTAKEKSPKETEESQSMEMTDARCSRCGEKQVGIADIIQAGGYGHGDRYQLECVACGNCWYASRDEISALTIDTPRAVNNVGAAPWATAKFEQVEKRLLSSRDSKKPPLDTFQKKSAGSIQTQKSFDKARIEAPASTHRS